MAVIAEFSVAVHVTQVDTRIILGGDAAVGMASRQLAVRVSLHQ